MTEWHLRDGNLPNNIFYEREPERTISNMFCWKCGNNLTINQGTYWCDKCKFVPEKATVKLRLEGLRCLIGDAE